MVTSILHPKMPADKFEEALLQWDRRVAEYEVATHVTLPSGVKTAVLMQNVPSKQETGCGLSRAVCWTTTPSCDERCRQ